MHLEKAYRVFIDTPASELTITQVALYSVLVKSHRVSDVTLSQMESTPLSSSCRCKKGNRGLMSTIHSVSAIYQPGTVAGTF